MDCDLLYSRPLLIPSLLLCAGIAISRYLPYPIAFLICIFILIFLYSLYSHRHIMLAVVLALGAYVGARAFSVNSDYVAMEGKTASIEGYVISQPVYDNQRVSFDFVPYNLNTKQRIRISVYGKRDLPHLEYGDVMLVNAKIKLPPARTNPYGFDYSFYLRKRGVYALGTASAEQCRVVGKRDMGVLGLAFKAKEIASRAIHRNLDNPYSDLLSSMLLGYRFDEDDIIADFSDTGVIHIMAISGLNVGVIVGAMLLLMKPLRNIYVKNTVVMFILAFYVFIVGFSPPILRAVIMAWIYLSSCFFDRKGDPLNSLAASAIVLLLFNPLNLFDVSFQLSFVATASLILLYPPVRRCVQWLPVPEAVGSLVAITISAQLGIIPFVIYYFHKISLISIVANIAVVPSTALLTPLGFLLIITGFIPFFSDTLVMPLTGIISYILGVTDLLSRLPFASITVPFPGFILIVLYYLFLLIFADMIIFDKKYALAGAGVATVLLMLQHFLPGPLTVTFIDVGQGDSALIVTPHKHTVLVDGGRLDVNSGFDAGKDIVVPYLLMSGIRKVDVVVATHPDSDHMGGLISVVDSIPVRNVFVSALYDDPLSKSFFKLLKAKGVTLQPLYRGDKVYIDGVKIEVLNPPKGLPFEGDNDNSLAIKLIYKKAAILFTGDMGVDAEKDLLSRGMDLRADVLKVSHHGSATATCQEFVNAVNPAVSVISVGENIYGHPSKDVLQRLRNTRVLRTDLNGAITVKTDGERYYIRPFLK
ncbi:DNA internalization-related competence protein ComEC/Rec2 [Caldanaerobius polysaccharolyticus]|uniref:DNA internalization-related competence protein ComEC/Rec2 n=1 Tax=Caldanaerobius polysaccharolyticus TaxID=44256 RepID=UPI00047AD904|nr:DNA internalization-related competence protein ComEC/Rec2 [Caldanaerobius polysaccharolyticus]